MQPAEVYVKERSRTLHALDAKGQGRSHRWLGSTHSKEIDGKEEWTNRENKCPTFALMLRSRRPWPMSRPISTCLMSQKEEKEVAKERKVQWFAIIVRTKDIGLPTAP